MIDRRTLWLALGCIIFVAAIAAEFESGGGPTSLAGVQHARAVPAPRPSAARLAPPEALTAEALARPLFSPTRRPPSSDGPASAELADKRLAGIVISPQQRLAIFAVKGAKPLMLKEGAAIDGWQIETITSVDVSLRGPSGTRTLRPRMESYLASGANAAAGGTRAGVPEPPPGGVLRHRDQ